MLKVITSVVLTLVTIMAVTLYAVTVPAQQKKIEENKTAIYKNTEYIQDVEDFAYTVDGITDGLNTRLETLEDKKLYKHQIRINESTVGRADTVIYSYSNTAIDDLDSLIDALTPSSYTSGSLSVRYYAAGISTDNYIFTELNINNSGVPNAQTYAQLAYYSVLNGSVSLGYKNLTNNASIYDNVNIVE